MAGDGVTSSRTAATWLIGIIVVLLLVLAAVWGEMSEYRNERTA